MTDGRDVWWHDIVSGQSDTCEPERMESEDMLYVLYTSGTTAKPKGIVHTTAGYLLGTSWTHKHVFDLKAESDVYWCAADIGWVTGHSYIVYGPLTNGATSVMYEGTPTYPGPDRWWDIIERYKVSILYTAPTAIRAHMKEGHQHIGDHDLSSLRVLGTVGEPINPEAWIWYHKHVGGEKAPIVDTWWQTETGQIMIAPLPGVTTTKPGSATFPLPGIDADIVDESGQSVSRGEGGYLVVRKPWPAMLRTIYGDPERYKETYWSRFEDMYFPGDGAKLDQEGYFWLLGRVDDVMNISGHRLSTTEIESALVSHDLVAEAAVVGYPDELTGEAIYAFVTLKSRAHVNKDFGDELRAYVGEKISPIAKPKKLMFTPDLPKTRSAKIMRRLLRDIASGHTLGDTTTLADASVVDTIRDATQLSGDEE
jgi:acetyl-CoA synthetase